MSGISGWSEAIKASLLRHNYSTNCPHQQGMPHYTRLPFHRTAALRLAQNRRRIAFAAMLAYPAGYLLYAHFQATALGLPVPVFAGLFYAAFVAIAACLICVFLPGLRFAIETVALSRFALASLAASAPELAKLLIGSPFVNATLVILGAALVHQIFYGSLARQAELAPAAAARKAAEWIDGAPYIGSMSPSA